jgi:hypothetical protein
MARPKLKQRKQRVNLTLDPGTVKGAKELADVLGISLSELVGLALRLKFVMKG